MKRILLFFIITLAVLQPLCAQTTYIANSNPGASGGVNVFTGTNSINLALAVAVTGDIIYVAPSSVIYSNPTLGGKGVTIVGGGFNPDKPGGALSRLGSVYANANNFKLSGLVINDVNIPGAFSNIMIEKCRVGNIGDGSGGSAKGNMIVQNCILGEATSSGSASIYIGIGSSNVRFSNNIIYAYSPSTSAMTRLNAAIIENNVFIGAASGGSLPAFSEITNSDIKNNIFYGIRPNGIGTFTGNTLQNNLSFASSDNVFPTINGNTSVNNIEGQDPLFADLPFGTAFNFSYDPTLQAGSPAKTTGFGGIEMGPFGGPTPFDIYGTSLPLVQTIISPASVNEGSDMTVRIRAKGN